ncbi:allantoicase [Xanthomonadaceae bacterium JHOS43]|nr:allantoicase [Xanthomonadaceae bacterium JHOS43]MCX7562127.1 allantoicase [Xanthomonadaceae bacterium XH05]
MALAPTDPNAPAFTRSCVNLADPRLGAKALLASDEFFAAKERMLDPAPAQFYPGRYDDHGKWMDGWETRRKRGPGHDWCIVRLARPGRIAGLDLDTSHFTGNFPPSASVEACFLAEGDPDAETEWFTLLPSAGLRGNSHHYFDLGESRTVSHVRVNVYPDGGLARLRVYGTPMFDPAARNDAGLIDLAAALNGGIVLAANNEHFGPASTMLLPGRGVNMGDGWETRRRREPGNDWCLIALAHPGTIDAVEVDTAHFKGNYPDRCSIQAARVTDGTPESLITQAMFWEDLLPEQKLQADHIHRFHAELKPHGPITHVRFNMIPDGGVSRLRLWGKPA